MPDLALGRDHVVFHTRPSRSTIAVPVPMVSACGVLPPPLSQNWDFVCLTYWITTVAARWPPLHSSARAVRPLSETRYSAFFLS